MEDLHRKHLFPGSENSVVAYSQEIMIDKICDEKLVTECGSNQARMHTAFKALVCCGSSRNSRLAMLGLPQVRASDGIMSSWIGSRVTESSGSTKQLPVDHHRLV